MTSVLFSAAVFWLLLAIAIAVVLVWDERRWRQPDRKARVLFLDDGHQAQVVDLDEQRAARRLYAPRSGQVHRLHPRDRGGHAA